jgi:uncharacterized protein YukE
MSLASGRNQLSSAYKALQQQWAQTERVWRDDVRREFQETWWDDMEQRLHALTSATDRLDQTLAELRTECG